MAILCVDHSVLMCAGPGGERRGIPITLWSRLVPRQEDQKRLFEARIFLKHYPRQACTALQPSIRRVPKLATALEDRLMRATLWQPEQHEQPSSTAYIRAMHCPKTFLTAVSFSTSVFGLATIYLALSNSQVPMLCLL